MSNHSVNASDESPASSPSSTMISSALGYIPFPEPTLPGQPSPTNQNNFTAGIPQQLNAGSTPYPRNTPTPIDFTIPLGQMSPQTVCNIIAT